MIENIIDIGKSLRENGESKTVAELWIKDNKAMDLAVIVDIVDDNIDVYIKEFEDDMYIQSLYYQQGNDLRKGSGVCVHNAKELINVSLGKKYESANKSFDKKILYSFEFLEINVDLISECKNKIIEEILEDTSKTYFIMITKDEKTPFELYREKFENLVKTLWKTNDKLSKSVEESICHNCFTKEKCYDTAIYKFYNNDKEAYSNIYNDINKDVFAYGLCEQCISDLLNGKQYIHENMTTKWLDTNVMFIPNELTDTNRKIYENGLTNADKTSSNDYIQDKLVKNLYKYENTVFNELSDANTITDIIFFETDQSAWKIKYSIQGVLPSRFGKLGRILSKYEQVEKYDGNKEYLYLKDIFELVLPGSTQINEEKKTRTKKIAPKEKMRIVDILLKSIKYNKTLFYRRALNEYKYIYLDSLKNDASYIRANAIRKINKIYNIFAELNCFDVSIELVEKKDGGGYKMIEFKNRDEFFTRNSDFFDCDRKKAWFILGELYSKAIYESKEYYRYSTSETSNTSKKSHLESAFLFDKKFDCKTFYQISDKVKMQFIKYGKLQAYESLFSEMRCFMANNTKLSPEEAKYIFFWGMEIFFTDNLKNKENSSVEEK